MCHEAWTGRDKISASVGKGVREKKKLGKRRRKLEKILRVSAISRRTENFCVLSEKEKQKLELHQQKREVSSHSLSSPFGTFGPWK